MTRDEILTVFPIDGRRSVTTPKGAWTVRVKDVREKPAHSFVISLRLEGNPAYSTAIHLSQDRLSKSVRTNEGEIGLILQAFTDLMNRALDKPKEQEIDLKLYKRPYF